MFAISTQSHVWSALFTLGYLLLRKILPRLSFCVNLHIKVQYLMVSANDLPFSEITRKENQILHLSCCFYVLQLDPWVGLEDSSERVGRVRVGTWLQLIVVPP